MKRPQAWLRDRPAWARGETSATRQCVETRSQSDLLRVPHLWLSMPTRANSLSTST